MIKPSDGSHYDFSIGYNELGRRDHNKNRKKTDSIDIIFVPEIVYETGMPFRFESNVHTLARKVNECCFENERLWDELAFWMPKLAYQPGTGLFVRSINTKGLSYILTRSRANEEKFNDYIFTNNAAFEYMKLWVRNPKEKLSRARREGSVDAFCGSRNAHAYLLSEVNSLIERNVPEDSDFIILKR